MRFWFGDPYFLDLGLRVIGFTKMNKYLVENLLAFLNKPRALRSCRGRPEDVMAVKEESLGDQEDSLNIEALVRGHGR